MANRFLTLLERIRRNHALEHATVHLLVRWDPSLRLVGRSDWTGFWLYGPVDTSTVRRVAQEALARLAAGEAALAVHPRCGTNIAAAALLGGLGAFTAARTLRRSRLAQWLGVLSTLLVATALGRSAGMALQRHVTTTAETRGLRIVAVEREQTGNWVIHHITTA
ncbi:MAG: hypothetical protein JXA74_10955 [Anaerolineae bacterium]|nr:hypothetical protein [Anaerolineae bacterium]